MRILILFGLFGLFSINQVVGQKDKKLQRLYLEFYDAYNNEHDLLATIKGDSLLSEIISLNYPIDTNVINIQKDIAFAHYLVGNYVTALDLSLSSKHFFETKWDTRMVKYDELLNVIARCYEEIGDYNTALEYFYLILKINEKKYGFYHQYSCAAYSHLASAYDHLGKYNEAIYFHDRAIEITIKLYGENHEQTLSSLSNKALNLRKSNDFNGALKLNNKVLSLRKKTLGKNHPDYLLSLYNTAELQGELGLFADAKEKFKICIESYENQFGIRNLEYINYLSGYAVFLEKIGSIETALMLNKRCLQLFHEVQGSNVIDHSRYLNNLGTTYLSTGNPAFAKNYLDSALQLSEQHFGTDHPYSILLLENIASCYGALGDYNKAIDKEVTCLERIAKKNGANSLEFASGLNQLAYYDSKLGIDSMALKWNKRAYEIRKEILGKEHPLTVSSLYNLSVDYAQLKLYDLALEGNFEVLRHRTKVFGENHQFTKEAYNNIGLCYSYLKDYPNALKYYLKCEDGNFGSTILVNFSSFYEKLGEWTKAIEYQDKAVSWYLEDYFKNQLYLSEIEKAKYKQNLDYYTSYLIYLNYKSGLSNNANNWYDKYISAINLINNGLISNTSSTKAEDNEKLEIVVNELQTLRISKNKLIELNSKEDLTNVKNRIEKLESQYSSLVGNPTNKLLKVEMLKEKLIPDNECFVDIVPFTIFPNSTSAYLAVITQKEVTSIEILDTLDNIASQIYSLYNQETSDQNKITDLKSEKFYNYLWKPIADKIGDAKTIYVSLGGVYNNINLNTLFNPETGKYLMEEKDIRIVNSARDFVLSKENKKKTFSTNTASLFGFPDFNGNTTVAADSNDFLASTRDLNSFWLDSLTRGGLKANPLPATKIEVENISVTLKSKGWQVNSYLAENASETNMKKEESPRILHIATHGYFFPDVPMEKDNTRFLGMDRQQVVQDPMLRSGLLFTGANRTLKGEESKSENGLLSAAEAALLDLQETELVVLSACETGKGEIKNSEGVYGLRKAFSDAGAQNIIMSLWKVDDEVTQEFMSLFYEIWLNEKTSIREAFNRTQLEIKAQYPQPYYWGAFILVGE